LLSERVLGPLLAGVGLAALVAAIAAQPSDAGDAAAQVWSPFVLVAGLLLIGLVADGDGLFAAAGHVVARKARNGTVLFVGSAVLIGAVTAVLNLDTAVAFLTPVLVYTARSRGEGEAPLLYGCILLANAGSLFLPGSNLTNLIVLGHLHLSGGQFLSRMWAPGLAALLVTAAVVGFVGRADLRTRVRVLSRADPPVIGVGLLGILVATALVLGLHSPALPVAATGIAAVAVRAAQGRQRVGRAVDMLGLPVLVGLFGIAVGLGTLGRLWSGPSNLLSHLGSAGTAAVASVWAVAVNNLPAASLLSARPPSHPFALLIGLNVGPNMFVTGSLAWILWLRSARAAGAEPSIARATRLGIVAGPAAMAASVGALWLTGAH
jgi:arsenical pump membrane protein